MQGIDQIDKKVLFELEKNARRSVKEIAKKLGMKRDTVAYRIKQLEKNKIIKGYYSIIDASKIGDYLLIRLYVKFQNTTPEIEKEIIEHFLSEKETFTVYKVEGDWDLAIGFLGESLIKFDLYNKRFSEKYKKHIHEQYISFFREYIQYYKNYLIEQNLRDYSSIVTWSSDKVKVDEMNKKILRIISEDAKIPLLDIAKKLKISSMAVRYRIKELEKKKVLLGYRAMIDLSKIGYEYYKIDLDLEDISKIKDLHNFATQHPNIIYEDITIGGSDFEFDVEVEDYDAFYSLIEEIKEKFPGLIRTYKFFRARKVYKYGYFPEA